MMTGKGKTFLESLERRKRKVGEWVRSNREVVKDIKAIFASVFATFVLVFFILYFFTRDLSR